MPAPDQPTPAQANTRAVAKDLLMLLAAAIRQDEDDAEMLLLAEIFEAAHALVGNPIARPLVLPIAKLAQRMYAAATAAEPTEINSWWLCPNTPRCPHAGAVHDIEDLEDDTPRCCIDGCDCGKPAETLPQATIELLQQAPERLRERLQLADLEAAAKHATIVEISEAATCIDCGDDLWPREHVAVAKGGGGYRCMICEVKRQRAEPTQPMADTTGVVTPDSGMAALLDRLALEHHPGDIEVLESRSAGWVFRCHRHDVTKANCGTMAQALLTVCVVAQ